jgi:hypothetical protein
MNLVRKTVTTVAVVAVFISLSIGASMVASATASPSFKAAGAIALDHHGNLWVANEDQWGITEIQASSGKVLRLVNAKADGFLDPYGIAISGNDVWVVSGSVTHANGKSKYGMVTELNAANGDLVRTVNLKQHGITGLTAVSAIGHEVWITADGGEQVVVLSAATGRVEHVYRGRDDYAEPGGIATGDGQVWIPSPEGNSAVVVRSAATGREIRGITLSRRERPKGGGPKVPTYLGPEFVSIDSHYAWTGNEGSVSLKLHSGSVTQFDVATGKVVRTIDTAADRFRGTIKSIVSDGVHVWIVNGTASYGNRKVGDTVTELNATNGSLVRVIHLSKSVYSNPVGIASNGTDVWVTDAGGGYEGLPSVIELSASTGAVVKTIGG